MPRNITHLGGTIFVLSISLILIAVILAPAITNLFSEADRIAYSEEITVKVSETSGHLYTISSTGIAEKRAPNGDLVWTVDTNVSSPQGIFYHNKTVVVFGDEVQVYDADDASELWYNATTNETVYGATARYVPANLTEVLYLSCTNQIMLYNLFTGEYLWNWTDAGRKGSEILDGNIFLSAPDTPRVETRNLTGDVQDTQNTLTEYRSPTVGYVHGNVHLASSSTVSASSATLSSVYHNDSVSSIEAAESSHVNSAKHYVGCTGGNVTIVSSSTADLITTNETTYRVIALGQVADNIYTVERGTTRESHIIDYETNNVTSLGTWSGSNTLVHGVFDQATGSLGEVHFDGNDTVMFVDITTNTLSDAMTIEEGTWYTLVDGTTTDYEMRYDVNADGTYTWQERERETVEGDTTTGTMMQLYPIMLIVVLAVIFIAIAVKELKP